MAKVTEEGNVKEAAKEYLEGQYDHTFSIAKVKWRCNEGTSCPDVHDVYAVATDNRELQVYLSIDFRKEEPEITQDTYHDVVASLNITEKIKNELSEGDYLIKAFVKEKPIGPLSIDVKLYMLNKEDKAAAMAERLTTEIIRFASVNKHERLNLTVSFFRNLPSEVSIYDFHLLHYALEEKPLESNRTKDWVLHTGGEELANPDSLLQHLGSKIRVVE